jgi:hypothetical protein
MMCEKSAATYISIFSIEKELPCCLRYLKGIYIEDFTFLKALIPTNENTVKHIIYKLPQS